MADPSAPKTQECEVTKGQAELDTTGTGLKADNSSGDKEAKTNDRGKKALTVPPSGKRLSDVSVGASTVTSAYHSSVRSALESQEMQIGSMSTSPRQSEVDHTPKWEGRQAWEALPSIRGLEPVDSDTKKVGLPPHTPAYVRRSAQELQFSGPTTARSTGTARTITVREESPDWAGLKEGIWKEENMKLELPPSSKRETANGEVPLSCEKWKTSFEPAPEVRRLPWIGPAYTAVHRPPYSAQTREHEHIENLLDPPRESRPLSNVEQFVVEQCIGIVGRRQCLSLSGRPHFTPYAHRAPAAGSYLEDYAVPPPYKGHAFDKDPLLRSVLTPQSNFPYIREQSTYHGQPLNYTHNDWMLDNVMVVAKAPAFLFKEGCCVPVIDADTTLAEKCCPGTVPTYADIPHFGRVQCIYMRQPDGTIYPLVTLPKMTPHDILNVYDRMQQSEYRKNPKQTLWRRLLCCGGAGEV